MNKNLLFKMITIFVICFSSLNLFAQAKVEYGNDFIVFEAEATNSSLAKWTLRKKGDANYQKYVSKSTGVDPINDTYLEYTGPWNGSTNTELEYKFTCRKSGNYRMLMRMHQPLRSGEAGDQRNDVFVRLHGDYTSATSKPKSELEKNHKFWGRGVNKWGSCHKLEIGGHLDAIYRLKEGEEYTFVMSGRSNGCCIDYILFVNNDVVGTIVNNDDIAIKFPENYRPGLGLVDPTALSIETDSLELRVGTSFQLKTQWEPGNANKDLTWLSSDSTIVSVDENGMVKAKGEVGDKVTITAKSTVADLTAKCEVSLVEWYAVSIESISIDPKADTISEGGTTQLMAVFNPADADDKSVTWSSENENVATVDQNGKVTAVGSGTAIIKATSTVNGSVFGAATIVVAEMIQPFFNIVNKESLTNTEYKVGEKLKVTVEFHAGTFQTVKEAIKVKFRQIKPGWIVQKDWFAEDLSEYIGTTSGNFTIDIPLSGLIPSKDLPTDHFYYIFTSGSFTNDVKINSSLHPIKVVGNEPNAVRSAIIEDDHKLLYPVPAKDLLFVHSSVNEPGTSITFWDFSGKLVYSEILNGTSKPINTNEFSSGIYLVKINNKEQIKTQKVIIK